MPETRVNVTAEVKLVLGTSGTKTGCRRGRALGRGRVVAVVGTGPDVPRDKGTDRRAPGKGSRTGEDGSQEGRVHWC